MTNEEVQQLKPGDKVLVEAEVIVAMSGKSPYIHITRHGNVAVKSERDGCYGDCFYTVNPSAIREKLAPPRRKFKEGDIVRGAGSNSLAYVNRDEFEDGRVFAGGWSTPYKAEELTLICAAEDRADRKEPA